MQYRHNKNTDKKNCRNNDRKTEKSLAERKVIHKIIYPWKTERFQRLKYSIL